jgi:hypothetical protein
MRTTGLTSLVLLLLGSAPAFADSRFEAMLKRIDPSERLEQACDYAAVTKISRDKNPYHPDRAMIDTLAPPRVTGDTMKGAGGAFRSGGRWYQFSFTCQATPDRLKVLRFDYQVGAVIPEDKWDKLGLWH